MAVGLLAVDWPAVAAADPTFLSMHGDGLNSILPRAGLRPPLPPPWTEWRYGPTTRIGETMGDQTIEAWVYDDKGQLYYRIDKIIAYLRKTLYPYRVGALYKDPGGSILLQQPTSVSDRLVDPDFDQHVRWTQWLIRRVLK